MGDNLQAALGTALRLQFDKPQDDVALALAGPMHGPQAIDNGRLDLNEALIARPRVAAKGSVGIPDGACLFVVPATLSPWISAHVATELCNGSLGVRNCGANGLYPARSRRPGSFA